MRVALFLVSLISWKSVRARRFLALQRQFSRGLPFGRPQFPRTKKGGTSLASTYWVSGREGLAEIVGVGGVIPGAAGDHRKGDPAGGGALFGRGDLLLQQNQFAILRVVRQAVGD